MLSNIPVVRDLAQCRREDHVEALKEVFATMLLALLPVWLGAAVLFLIPKVSVAHYVGEFMSSGEALLVSAALVGPSIYIITKKYGELPNRLTLHFPQGWFLVLLSFVLCIVITAVFALQRIYSQVVVNHTPNAGPASLFDAPSMQGLSGVMLFIGIGCLYVVTVFRNFVEGGASSEMRSDTAEFLRRWDRE